MKNPLHYIQEDPHRTKQILGITNDQFQDLLAQAEMQHNELQVEKQEARLCDHHRTIDGISINCG